MPAPTPPEGLSTLFDLHIKDRVNDDIEDGRDRGSPSTQSSQTQFSHASQAPSHQAQPQQEQQETMMGANVADCENVGRVAGWWAKRQSLHVPRTSSPSSWLLPSSLHDTPGTATHAQRPFSSSNAFGPTSSIGLQMRSSGEEKVRLGSLNITVSVLQGPQNHAIWKARLLSALNAEDEHVHAAATGALRLKTAGHGTAEEDDDVADTPKSSCTDLQTLQHQGASDAATRQRAHTRAVAMIMSTLPDETFAMVVNHNYDAFKLMEALDARFRPYPRYAGL